MPSIDRLRPLPLRPIAAALLLILGCGSDDSRTLRITKGAAIRDGIVTGYVIDDESELPVRAEVVVNGIPVRANADGSFQAPVTAGRVRVEVRSDGYLKTYRDVAVGAQSLPMPFKIARRAPKVAVGPAGGTIPSREAQLVVPVNAYTGNTFVSLTYLSHVRIAAIAEMPQFIDQAGVPRRAVALVDLANDQPPAMPVRARVPVPADATADSVAGFVIDAGHWTTPIVPESVSDGFAEFTLMGDTQIGVAIDTRKADGKKVGYLVTERGGSGKDQGELVMGGNDLATAGRAVAIVDPQGSRVEMAAGTRARVEVPEAETPSVASRAPFAGTVEVTAGRARVVVPPPVADAPKLVKLVIKGNAATFEITGTAFTLTTCGTPPNAVDFLEVVEGTVGAKAGNASSDIGALETATVCTNCQADAGQMCLGEEPSSGDDSGVAVEVDANASDMTAVGSVADAGVTDAPAVDAAADDGGAADAPEIISDAPMLPPPPPPADAGAIDVMLPADMAALKPDAAAPMPDAMVVVVPPDAAPDVAPPPPDVAPDMAPPPPDVAVDLQSLGSDARLAAFTITPGSHDFGSLLIGNTSAAFNFQVTNQGDLPSDVPTIDATGDFIVSTNGCSNPVPAGASCIVGISFKPQAAGALSGIMHAITSGGSTSGASLTGTGMAPAPAQFALSPLSATFWGPEGYSTTPSNRDVTFTLTNMGGTASAIPAISFGGKDATAFGVTITRIMPKACPNALAPGASCPIIVHFAPPAMSVPANALSQGLAGTLDITGNPGGSASASLTGNASLSHQLRITPANNDFGALKVGGTSAAFTFTVTNTGTGAVSALSFNFFIPITTGPPPPQDFGYDITDCTQTKQGFLDVGASCVVQASFVPKSAGAKQKFFEVSGASRSMPNTPAQATAEVQGTGQ